LVHDVAPFLRRKGIACPQQAVVLGAPLTVITIAALSSAAVGSTLLAGAVRKADAESALARLLDILTNTARALTAIAATLLALTVRLAEAKPFQTRILRAGAQAAIAPTTIVPADLSIALL